MAPKRSVKISAPVKKMQCVPDKIAKRRPKRAKLSKVPDLITISVPVTENGSGALNTRQKFKVDINIPMPIEDAKALLLKSSVEKKVQTVTPALRRGRSKTETVSELSAVNNSTTPVEGVMDTERKVDLKTKVALANEVARSQLLKEPIEARVNTTPPVPKKSNRRSKPQTISEFFNKKNMTRPLKNNLKAIKPLVLSKNINKKAGPDMKAVATRKRKADSTEQKPASKRRNEPKTIKKEQNELKVEPYIENKNITTKTNLTESNTDQPVLKSCNASMVMIPMTKRRLWRGNNKNDDSETKTTPNLLIESSNLSKSEVNHCKSPILQTSNTKSTLSKDKTKDSSKQRSRHRQISTSSISDLSWTHDISSSSTTTCITVSSKDFVCFNNKIPMVKLRNIQNNVKNPQHSNEINEDITSSDIETSCDKPISLIDSNSLIKVNPLNLSSSSNDSSNKQINDGKTIVNEKDYTQAAKNLEQALEKIDMEFINWIPETEYVSLDFNKLQDKLFDILKSELRALTHCKILKEISTNFNENEIYSNYDHNKFEIATESVVGNNVIQNKITYDTTIPTKEIETDYFEQHSIENRVKANGETSEINKNKPENRNDSEGEVSKSKTSGSDINKLPKDSMFLKEDSFSGREISLDNEELKNSYSLHDDDDALSLFAESITGIESSKLNISTASVSKQIEEYIPEPIQNKPNYNYCPTKIAENKNITKIVCEKQNADSTSIYRESNNITPIFNESVSYSDNSQENVMNNLLKQNEYDNIFCTDDTNILNLYKDFVNTPDSDKINIDKKNISKESLSKRPYLIADKYTLKPKTKNIIFKGICYFNLLGRCNYLRNNKMCMFSHHIPDENEIKETLCTLSNELFIREYMLCRRSDRTMHKYGICFVKVCVERKLTRLLLEMALDFIKGSFIEESLKVNVVELTLIHLNNVDLCECDDLLKINVRNGTMLCEIFMQIMTSSQNFSRFKPVFLSLTYFMVNNDRKFSIDVAEQVLERVSILAFDESLVRALLQIMRLTNREIFLNSMIVQFEKQISVNSDILAEYMSLKRDINFGNTGRWVENRPLLPAVSIGPSHTSTARLMLTATEEQPLSELREVALPPSPDTTHLENMNKSSEDTINVPKITRTVSSLSSSQFSPSVVLNTNRESIKQSPNFQNWRNKSIMQHLAESQRRIMRPPLQLRTSTHRKSTRWHDHRQVTLEANHTNVFYPDAKY